MKAKIDNNVWNIKIVDSNYDVDRVEVKILEGQFKGKNCIINKSDLVTKGIKSKIVIYSHVPSAYDKEYADDERFLSVMLYATDEEILINLAEYIENNVSETTLDFDCIEKEGEFYTISSGLEYEHGYMTTIKKDIKDTFKEAKKVLNIK